MANDRQAHAKLLTIGAVLTLAVFSGQTTAEGPQQVPVVPGDQQNVAKHAISGICLDERDEPLVGVRVRVFRVDGAALTREMVGDVRTDDSGDFHFPDLPTPILDAASGYFRTYYVLVLNKPGYASWLRAYFSSKDQTNDLRFQMALAGTLSGRITDSTGKPVEGAQVFTVSYPSDQPIEGCRFATTDANGHYELVDLLPWKQRGPANGVVFDERTTSFLTVLHPDYAMTRPGYTNVPATVDVVLEPAARIKGRVFDVVTKQPAIGAIVSMQGVGPNQNWHQARTDATGAYQLTSVEKGKYNIWANAPDRTCVAIDSLEVGAGQTFEKQDITLINGSWIEGRVIDSSTDKPVTSYADGRRLRVAIQGPSRPRSGAAVDAVAVGDDGRFQIRVAPGINYPYIMYPGVWNRVEQRDRYKQGVEVRNGERLTLDFRVGP